MALSVILLNGLMLERRYAKIELTLRLRQAVAQQGETPPRAVDPDTHTPYVLIPEMIYARVKALLDEEEANQLLRDMYPHVMEVFGREGWMIPRWTSTMTLIPVGSHERQTR